MIPQQLLRTVSRFVLSHISYIPSNAVANDLRSMLPPKFLAPVEKPISMSITNISVRMIDVTSVIEDIN